MKKMYKVSKYTNGRVNTFVVMITDKLLKDEFGDEQCLCEWLGEHTSGGSCYGYRVTTQRIYKAPKKYKCYDIKTKQITTVVLSSDKHKKWNKNVRKLEDKKHERIIKDIQRRRKRK